jgi:hypothetical protein
MRCSYYPQSLVRICGANREIGVRFERVDSRVLFIPSCPGATGLTGALDRSDRCESLVGFVSGNCLVRVVLSRSPTSQFLAFWSCFARFWEGFSFVAVVFWRRFFPGPRGVTKASWNVCCAASVATDLTGVVHQSDRCRPSV